MADFGRRPFSSLFHALSLTSAPIFIEADTVYGKESQLNILHREKHYFKMKNFKPVQNAVVTIRFNNAAQEFQEERDFCHTLEHGFPRSLSTQGTAVTCSKLQYWMQS